MNTISGDCVCPCSKPFSNLSTSKPSINCSYHPEFHLANLYFSLIYLLVLFEGISVMSGGNGFIQLLYSVCYSCILNALICEEKVILGALILYSNEKHLIG